MSIIIRLQHLPWSADAADVREFFRGLIIPEGGVHIVGGRDGDVFVQFSSDEDARLAMKNDGKRLKDAKIKLLLSSQKEMQKVIEKARSDYAAGLVTPNFDSRAASDDEDENDKKRSSSRRSRSRSGSKERSHHIVQRNAQNVNSAVAPAYHQPTNFQTTDPAAGVMAQFAPPLQYPAALQPQAMAMYSRQMGALPGQLTMPLPVNMQQFAMAQAYPAPLKAVSSGDQDARLQVIPPSLPAPFFNMFQQPMRAPMDHHAMPIQAPPSSMQAPLQAPPAAAAEQPPTFGGRRSPERSQQQHDHRRDRGSLLPMPAPAKTAAASVVAEQKMQPPPPLLTNAQAHQAPQPPDLTQMPLMKPPNLSQQLAFQNQFSLGHLQNMMIDQQQQQQLSQKPVIDRSMFREGVFMDNVIAPGRQDQPKNALNQQVYEPEACVCAENVPKDMLRYGTIRDFFAPLRLEGPDSIKLFDLGAPSGNVYCRFLTRQEAQLALRLDGKKQGVRVRLCSDIEFDNIRDTTKASPIVENKFNPPPHFDSRIWNNSDIGAPKNGPSSSYALSDRRSQEDHQQNYHKPQPPINQDKVVEISNIPYKAYDQAIWRLIEETRPKRLHRKLRLKDGKWLAFDTAFVEYYTIEDAQACFKFNGCKFDGRPLSVNWATSSVLDSSTLRTYNGHGPPSSSSTTLKSRPSPDYTLGTATSRDDKVQQKRRSRSKSRDRSRRRDKSRDRDRERSYDKDRDRDRKNRDRNNKRTRRSSKDRSPSRDKRRRSSRSPQSTVDSPKASSSSQAVSDVSPLTTTTSVEQVGKDKKDVHNSVGSAKNIQPTNPPSFEPQKPIIPTETPVKESKPTIDNGTTSKMMTCIFMSGLGPNVNVGDILNFFKSFNPLPAGVRLNLEPRGTAYVEFDSAAGCEQAFRCKNRHYIGVQMVTLRMCHKSEMTESVQKQHNLTPSSNGSSSTATPTAEPPKNLQSVPPTTQNKPSQQQNDFNSVTKAPAQGTRASGIGLLGMGPPSLARNEPPIVQHSHSNGNSIPVNAGPQPLLATPAAPPPGILGVAEAVPPAVASIDPGVVQALGPPGAVCFLHNLPPRITLEEICALFPFDARLIEDSVRMHYSHQTGEPTGDCLLAFQASQDAEKACRSINGRLISGRFLQMWIVPKSGK